MKKTEERKDVEIFVSNWMGEFQETIKTKSINTQKAILRDLTVFMAWWEKDFDEVFSPEKLTNWDLHQYRKNQVEIERVAAATWNRRLTTLKRFVLWARSKGYISIDILDGLTSMPYQQTKIRWLSDKDFGNFMRQVQINVNVSKFSDKDRAYQTMAMVGLMAYAGLREGEVVNVRSEDITINERSGKVRVLGKGKKERYVPLSNEARRLISPWLEICSDRMPFKMDERSVQYRIKNIGKKAGLDLSPHQLRHTFCKRMANNGVGLEKIRELAGHENIRTTEIYIKAGWDDLSDAVEKV